MVATSTWNGSRERETCATAVSSNAWFERATARSTRAIRKDMDNGGAEDRS